MSVSPNNWFAPFDSVPAPTIMVLGGVPASGCQRVQAPSGSVETFHRVEIVPSDLDAKICGRLSVRLVETRVRIAIVMLLAIELMSHRAPLHAFSSVEPVATVNNPTGNREYFAI
jgi:hypothetical protein